MTNNNIVYDVELLNMRTIYLLLNILFTFILEPNFKDFKDLCSKHSFVVL